MFYVIANNLALDLVNTRVHDKGAEIDLLASFDDLLDWGVATELMEKATASRFRRQWRGTREANAILDEIVSLRELFAELTVRIVRSGGVEAGELKKLNRVLARRAGHFEIRKSVDGYEKRFHAENDDMAGVLVSLAESMADLICFGDLEQVRKCEGDECALHFYDTSKNHRRRWCSMAACGNRAKADAFYKRKRLDRKV